MLLYTNDTIKDVYDRECKDGEKILMINLYIEEIKEDEWILI